MNMSNKSGAKVVAIITTNVFAIAFANARADDVQRVKLFVRETPITVNGRTINMCSVVQADGTPGYLPEQSGGFHVEVVNQLKVPTTLHWHGLTVPNSMDCVPFVTQAHIQPGASAMYDFPLKESGTYWMHSHYGLQEQYLVSAPLVIWNDQERAKADKQFIVTLTDFTFTPPAEILKQLRNAPAMDMGGMNMGGAAKPADGMGGMNMNGAAKPADGMGGMNMNGAAKPADAMGGMNMNGAAKPADAMGGMNMNGAAKLADGMGGMNMNGASAESAATLPPVFTQHWDKTNSRLVRAMVNAAPANIDVKYDALLANKRTIDNPEVMSVKPGQTVLLRIIAASVASDFFINTGALDAELLAVDGQPVQPLRGNYFQLSIAQRLDLRVTIPQSGGAFPIIAQGEGTTLQCGVVLATDGANIAALPTSASMLTTALDNTQELLLRASAPLAAKKIDRSLPAVLSGTMQGYQWFINGNQYPNRNTLDVKLGERVEIVLINNTPMGHPMHLHDGAFQVVEINGKPISGAQRDTIEVPPHATIKIAFDADNIGLWPLHCHIGYHADSGMMTLLKYDGADTQFWQPEQVKLEKLSLD